MGSTGRLYAARDFAAQTVIEQGAPRDILRGIEGDSVVVYVPKELKERLNLPSTAPNRVPINYIFI